MHPQYTKSTYYADVALLFLDRELPVPITPVAKWHLDDGFIGQQGTLVGFGAILSRDAMLTQTEGFGIKRTGQAPFLGSPAADMVTDHPGIGLPAVRSSLAMFDGSAPNANGCGGDSGGPILFQRGSREYVYGVSAWTGYYCENYSFYTRVDSFLPFIEEGVARAGRGPVQPLVDCVRPLPNGGKRAYFGYTSHNDVSLDIPLGANNRMPADRNGVRPTHFAPGVRHFVASADFGVNEQPLWKVQAPSGHTGVLSQWDQAPQCAPDDFMTLATDVCVASGAAHCGMSVETCVENLGWEREFAGSCGELLTGYLQCQTTLAAADFTCVDGYALDLSDKCMDPAWAYWSCIEAQWAQ